MVTFLGYFILTGILWTRCSDEQLFPGNARIKTAFRLTSSDALGGTINIQQAYLKLEGITVTGKLGDENLPDANYPIPPEDPPYRLTEGDTARVSLTLPTRTYDQMDLHLFLFQTDYKLIVHQKAPEENPPPVSEGDDGSTGGITDPGNGNGGGATDGDNETTDDDGGGRDEESDQDDSDDNDSDTEDDRGDSDGDDDEGDKGDDRDDDKGDQKKDDKKGKDEKKDKKNDDDKDKKNKNDDDGDDREGDDGRISGNELDGNVDLDDFFQHAKPSLVVFATWAFNGESINIVFAVTEVERLTIRALQNNGSQILIDDHGQGTVNFDPERWFQSISTTDLQNASLQTYQGQPVMFIHRDVNGALFETLMTNLTSSTTFEVATSSEP